MIPCNTLGINVDFYNGGSFLICQRKTLLNFKETFFVHLAQVTKYTN